MTVRTYSSTDASAPVLRGNTPGDLINLLEKCLVTGYGSQVGAGWTKPFAGTNVAAFRNGAGSNGMYLRVDDTSTATGGRSARIVGYETMTDINTGSPNPFPLDSQLAGGLWVPTKESSSNASTARPWRVWADEKLFYMQLRYRPESDVYEYNVFWGFGDINSYMQGDSSHTVIIGYYHGSYYYSSQDIFVGSTTLSSGSNNMYAARSYTQIGGSKNVGWHTDYVKFGSEFCGGGMAYPHGPDGGLYMAPVWCHEPVSPYNVRGIFPGLWSHGHNAGILNHLDTFQGQGDLAGRSFIFIRGGFSSGLLIEQSDTWR